MKLSRVSTSVAMTAIAALTLVGCASEGTGDNAGGGENGESTAAAGGIEYTPAEGLKGGLNATGASSQEKAQLNGWVPGYQKKQSDVTINYEGTGSGAGRDNFVAGTSDFIGSDRAFKAEEIEKSKFPLCADGSDLVEIPAYISPIAIAFNVPGVEELNLDAETIAKIFDGKITKWNDEAIASLNDGVELPDSEITPIHRGDKSGTTENFTDYLAELAPEAWTHEPDKEWPAGLPGEGANKTGGVGDAIRAGEGTIGYLDASAAGDLTTASIKSGEEFVPYSAEAAAKIVEASELESGRAETDLAYELNFEGGDGSYPIVLVSYLIGCTEYKDAEKGKLVKDYFSYVISDEAQQTAGQENVAGSAPLSPAVAEKAKAAVDAMK